jgi:hypothetical protein
MSQEKNGTADVATKTVASPEVRNVYFTLFSDNKNIIVQNVNLGVNGITGRLAGNGVIEKKCVKNITRLHLNDKEKRGTVLIDYLLDENDVDRYEGFLDVWATDDADTIRTEIHEALINQGLEVPERWARA